MIPLQTASGHPVTHIVFGPDGNALAVAQPHYGVTVIERGTGRTVAVCEMPRRAALTGLTFCADGRFLAASHAKGTDVFDAHTGKPSLPKPHGPYRSLMLAARDDLALAVKPSYLGLARAVFQVSDRGVEVTGPRLFYRGAGAALGLSANGERVLAIEHDRYVLLDVVAGRVVGSVECPVPATTAPRPAAGFCPHGQRFAISDGNALAVYDSGDLCEAEDEGEEQQADTPLVQRATGTQTAVAVAPAPHAVLAPTFTLSPPDPKFAGQWFPPFALAADGRGLLVKRPRNRVQWWDAPSGSLVNEWSWRFEWVTCLAASADGQTAVAGGRFGRVLIWDLD
jgi:hypothetical protein